jgi:Kef-type K+ transport system membrane component KefB
VRLLGVLAVVILSTKLLGSIAQRLGQSAVLGELLAGVILGTSALGVLDAREPVIQAFSQIGILVLLFQIGLHTDLRSLRQVGGTALMVAGVGVVLPFAGGVVVARAMGAGPAAALIAGAALSATSIGVSARLLSDLGRLRTVEGQVVLGAAIADDVIGLIILSVVSATAVGNHAGALDIAQTSLVAVAFVVAALVFGGMAITPVLRLAERLGFSGALGLLGLAFALLLAGVAEASGSSMVIGAFAGGLVLHRAPQRPEIEVGVSSLGQFFVPMFFAAAGAAVDVRAFASGTVLAMAGALVLVGMAGKIVAGYAPWWFEGNKLLVGVAMVPRGEVGLIVAQVGLASGIVSPSIFAALMMVVAMTTFASAPLLALVARRAPVPNTGEWLGAGGIDDLVAGARQKKPRATVAVQRKTKHE